MRYKRTHIIEKSICDLIVKIEMTYNDYRLVSVVYNKTYDEYVAFLEREVE